MRPVAVLLIALCACAAFAQDPDPAPNDATARVETVGEIILRVPTAYADVWIRHTTGADTLEVAIRGCETFAKELEPALRAAGVQSLEVYTAAPVIMDVAAPEAAIRARVRLRLGLQGRTEQGFADLGHRIGMVKATANKLNASDLTVKLLPADPASAEHNAIQRATEQAYPRAEAVAQAMGTQVFGVEHVEVENVDWPEYTPEDQATLDTRLCRAKVRVVYLTLP